jgi:hypothetical protein
MVEGLKGWVDGMPIPSLESYSRSARVEIGPR